MHENTMFQSTLPYGSVSIARLSAKDLSVSIHTPLRECFEPNERLSNHVYVSIHTPLRECFQAGRIQQSDMFQSTLPYGSVSI